MFRSAKEHDGGTARPRPGPRGAASPGVTGLATARKHEALTLLVMGGSCQRTWEHAIPKLARCDGPRISVQFRPHGVR